MARILETASIVPEIVPCRASETHEELVVCAGQRQAGMILDARKVDIQATGSKELSDGLQFGTVWPNSQPQTACPWRREECFQGNQERISPLKRVSEQCTPESQVGIHDSEARTTEDLFFGNDDSRKLTPVPNHDTSRHPTFGNSSEGELGIEQGIIVWQ